MNQDKLKLNSEVTDFLNLLQHPQRSTIELLRKTILLADAALTENIKWNGPNYSVGNEDRITIKIQPLSRPVQLILHRGVKKQEQLRDRIINHSSKLLQWKENDRAVITFKTLQEIEDHQLELSEIVSDWIAALR